MPSTPQSISNLKNLPEAPVMRSNETTVVLTDESMAKFQAQMADLASLIDSYHARPNETSKAACDEMLRTALEGLPAESRENAMQNTPPRVYSYYQESFKGVKTAGNDKKEALIQAQIHQDQQQVLTAQQIAQIKLQAAKDYSDFWSKYDHFDWEHSSKEEILRHINETPQMMLNWMQQIDKNAEKLPPELQQAYRLQSLQEGIEQKKQEAEKFQRLEEEARERGDTEAADKYRVAAQNANIQGKAMAATKNKVEKKGGSVKDSYTEKNSNGESIEQGVEEDTNSLIQQFNKGTNLERNQETTEAPKNKITQMSETAEQNIQRLTQQLDEMKQNGTGTSYEKTQVMAELKEAQKMQTKIENMNNAEQDIQSLKQQLHEMEQNGTGTSYEKMQLMAELNEAQKSYDERLKYENAEQNVQRLTQQLDEMEQNGTGTSYEKTQVMADLNEAQKYSRELNGEKTSQGKTQPTSNKHLASTKETKTPAAPKVPNENNADNTENTEASDNITADTHSNAEESDKSTESVSGLTTLKQAGTKIDNDESNYQFRTTGLELA